MSNVRKVSLISLSRCVLYAKGSRVRLRTAHVSEREGGILLCQGKIQDLRQEILEIFRAGTVCREYCGGRNSLSLRASCVSFVGKAIMHYQCDARAAK